MSGINKGHRRSPYFTYGQFLNLYPADELEHGYFEVLKLLRKNL